MARPRVARKAPTRSMFNLYVVSGWVGGASAKEASWRRVPREEGRRYSAISLFSIFNPTKRPRLPPYMF